MPDQVGARWMQVWRTIHDFGQSPFMCKLSKIYNQLLHCTCRVLSLALEKQADPHKILFNRDGMINTWNSHVWSLDNPRAST